MKVSLVLLPLLAVSTYGLQTLFDSSRNLYFVNSGLIDRPNSYWDGKRVILCTSCKLKNGTIAAFQSFLKDASKSANIYFQIWRPSVNHDENGIYTLLFNKQYDPAVLGSKDICGSAVHTVVLRPEENVMVEEGDVLGVYLESGATLAWSFDDRMLERRPEEREFTIYDNYISSLSLKEYESRRFGNLQVATNVSIGAIIDSNSDHEKKKCNFYFFLNFKYFFS